MLVVHHMSCVLARVRETCDMVINRMQFCLQFTLCEFVLAFNVHTSYYTVAL